VLGGRRRPKWKLDDQRINHGTLEALGPARLEAGDRGWTVDGAPSRGEMDCIREVSNLIERGGPPGRLEQFAEPTWPVRSAQGPGAQSNGRKRRLRQAPLFSWLAGLCALSLVPWRNPASARRCGCPWPTPCFAITATCRDNLIEEMLQAASPQICRRREAGSGRFESGNRGSPPSRRSGNEVTREHLELAGIICAERRSELWSNGGKPSHPINFRQRGSCNKALTSLAIPCVDRHLVTRYCASRPGRRS